MKLFRSLWLIVAFSLLVHLPGITSPLLDYQAWRQCQTASMARNYVRHGMHFLQPELDTDGFPRRAGTEFPIYSYLLAVLFKLFGIHDILGRLLSGVFAAWGAVFLYLFVRRRLDERIALASALIVSVIPVHLFFTRTVQPEPMALWGLLGFVYLFDEWLDGGNVLGLLAAIGMGALAPLLKLPYLYLVIPLALALAWEHGGWRAWRKVSFLMLLAGIVGITWAWYRYTRSAPVAVLPLLPSEQWQNLKSAFTWRLYENQFISRFPELCTTYPGLLLGGVGAWYLWKQRSARIFFLWIPFAGIYTALLGEYGLIHRYTLLPWAPLTAVFIAAGIVGLKDRWAGSRTGRKALLLILILGIPVHAGLRIKHWYRLERMWLPRAKEIVDRGSPPGELVFTQSAEQPVLLYSLDRYGFSGSMEEFGFGLVDASRARGARIFVSPTEGAWTRHPEWATALASRGRLIASDPDFVIYTLQPSPH